ncbi:MAG: Rid family hydrolase [Phycisphaerales bacterium]|nr:Rid family hydrolase [Phycisphaerales bacterium]
MNNYNLQTVSTNNQWETKFGYARINACGPHVYIGGTVAINPDGSPHYPGNAAAQTTRCFEIIEQALNKIHMDRSAIMRSRIFVTDISHSQSVGLAHKAFFSAKNPNHTPCLTQVEVSALISPDFVVEIECDAFNYL